MKKIKKPIIVLIMAIDVVFLFFNGLLWGYALSFSFKMYALSNAIFKSHVYVFIDNIKEGWSLWGICAFLLFIINVFCFNYFRKKRIIILSVINILLSPIAFFVYAGTH